MSTTAKQRTPSNFLDAYHVSVVFSPNEANFGSKFCANATLNSGIKPGNALLITLAPVLIFRSLSIIL